jgi:hypothetical protein
MRFATCILLACSVLHAHKYVQAQLPARGLADSQRLESAVRSSQQGTQEMVFYPPAEPSHDVVDSIKTAWNWISFWSDTLASFEQNIEMVAENHIEQSADFVLTDLTGQARANLDATGKSGQNPTQTRDALTQGSAAPHVTVSIVQDTDAQVLPQSDAHILTEPVGKSAAASSLREEGVGVWLAMTFLYSQLEKAAWLTVSVVSPGVDHVWSETGSFEDVLGAVYSLIDHGVQYIRIGSINAVLLGFASVRMWLLEMAPVGWHANDAVSLCVALCVHSGLCWLCSTGCLRLFPRSRQVLKTRYQDSSEYDSPESILAGPTLRPSREECSSTRKSVRKTTVVASKVYHTEQSPSIPSQRVNGALDSVSTPTAAQIDTHSQRSSGHTAIYACVLVAAFISTSMLLG